MPIGILPWSRMAVTGVLDQVLQERGQEGRLLARHPVDGSFGHADVRAHGRIRRPADKCGGVG
jgi:hypothetical protein